MKVPSNRLNTVRDYYAARLLPIYDSREAKQLMQLLIKHFFGFDKVNMALQPELRLSESELLQLHFAVKELLSNKPLQYVLGETEFYGRRFITKAGALIPRPETAQLIDLIIDNEKNRNPLSILDIGTGSGCMAVSLALEFPEAKVTAFDVSAEALEIARENAGLYEVEVDFIKADLLTEKQLYLGLQADLIVSNPPYVRLSEKALMHKNVTEWEPELALFVPDDDPLLFYRALAQLAAEKLNVGGSIWVEINEVFAQEVMAVFAQYGLSNPQCFQDFHGKDRFVRAEKS
ncbi:MAG: peptide chain release factor N(5)-glutamine methyltransferase [Bacteroidales bacterium]|jgi:release factor glutamine methyltransferase|nr:peptide chain release factor N(5)-glutamine methyltransferase [Bacteroidales bacterium]